MFKIIKRILKNNNESYTSFTMKAVALACAVYVFIAAWLLLIPGTSA